MRVSRNTPPMSRLFPLLLLAVSAAAPAAPEVPAQGAIALTLAQAQALMLEHNRDLIAARRALEGSRAERIAAGQRPNPNLSVSTVSVDPRGVGAGAPWDKTVDTIVQVSQLLERGSKRELRESAADRAVEAASADVEDARRVQIATVAQAYFDLELAQEKVTVSRGTAEAYRRTLDAAQLRLRAGDIAPSDVARISVDALRAENDLRQSAADTQRARVALAFLIGLESRSADLEAVDPWPALGGMPSLPSEEMLAARPDVRAAQQRLASARSAAQLAGALRSRDVTVFAQVERFPGQPQNNTVGVGVSVPLFLNYTYQGEIRRAEVAVDSATDNLERVRAAARAEVQRAWSDLASARERVQRFETQLLAAARKAADGAEFAYQRGALGVIDLLDARRALHATELDAANAHADYAKSLAAWSAATGGAAGAK